jgi:hypothetical protein
MAVQTTVVVTAAAAATPCLLGKYAARDVLLGFIFFSDISLVLSFLCSSSCPCRLCCGTAALPERWPSRHRPSGNRPNTFFY